MKNILRNTIVGLVIAGASMAYGAVPQLSVTVSDASGKMAYKGATNAQGAFTTATLKPGGYVVQLNAKSADAKGTTYAVVVSAGTKKVVASEVQGATFAAGGVAMKIQVGGGLSITGLVLPTATKDGKKMVWISADGNKPGHWVEADSAEAKQVMTSSSYSRKNIQDKQSNQQSEPKIPAR